MKQFIKRLDLGGRLLFLLTLCAVASAPAWADDRHMMTPRVPSDQIEQARALINPLPQSIEIIEKGKALYEGTGTCITCHGPTGRGDGPGAVGLHPPPRNFHLHGFWRHRTEGEIFWVIKHGSPGTAMIGFGHLLSDEDIWAIIQYERSFSGGHGRSRHMGDGGMKRMGKHGQDESGCKPRHADPMLILCEFRPRGDATGGKGSMQRPSVLEDEAIRGLIAKGKSAWTRPLCRCFAALAGIIRT